MKLLNRFKKILIVEDEPSLLKALTSKCEHEGYRVIRADSGKDVLLQVLHEKPDGILLDLMLPVHDGMEILEKLRSQDINYTKSVIILTNLHGQAALRSQAEKLNAQYFDKASTPIETAVGTLISQM